MPDTTLNQQEAPSFESPAVGAAEVTPNDSEDLARPSRALLIGGAGNVTVDMSNGDNVTLTGLLAGGLYPVRVKRVYATDTTATNIVSLY